MSESHRSSLRRRTQVTFAIAWFAAAVMILLGIVTFNSLLDSRARLVDRIDPAVAETERLLASIVDQETGVRAFVLTGEPTFLDSYTEGLANEQRTADNLRRLIGSSGAAAERLDAAEEAAAAWRGDYADPTLVAVRAGDESPRTEQALLAGRARFDTIRASFEELQRTLSVQRRVARADLDDATLRLIATLIAASLIMVLLVGSSWRLIRRSVQRPLDGLRLDAMEVAGGDVEHSIVPVGPSELYDLGVAMEEMRTLIVSQLADSRQMATDLSRSNTELEQFAYVASHDLQEPLRKVASFCQLLQNRYADQLDERANQYIDFAVDGAKRMQALIHDLLAFSRVGRMTSEFVPVDLASVSNAAVGNLAAAIEESGATIDIAPLPNVMGERGLLGAVFQNLIGNAIKYRRTDVAPHARVTVSSDGERHEFVVSDNGIGIEPEYAERVFVIFQRLHSKEAYEGTGIGLSLCRKIVEYHGGQIWVATDVRDGTSIHFTLPVTKEPTT